ncbi:sulfotransferase family protein [Metabacillus bambusae]|uniref:Sulfotransferase domain-containing protein n=1 Tax=Metabacillus bambusae TaxID=2795218 RepID=A0ABS3N5H1_9BACI|nr:sulfotransferase domain-containing protein [Metabacillus bambusae]MBO1513128.1 sulfotransferase domain-containing protein [Metabacillus bambusae]
MSEDILQDDFSKQSIPHFLIIGAQKCGTTSLYNYLIQHPQIIPALSKEVHFFDIYFEKGMDWYRNQFPSLESKRWITGEASPYYLFHPHAPKRIHQFIPKIKLIVLLRNPVDRAYSHYHHQVRMGTEPLSFNEAIKKEESRLKPERIEILKNENYHSPIYQNCSYLARGRYVEQLKNWMNFFSMEQFLIIRSEDFYSNPTLIFHRVLDFLGVQMLELKQYTKHNFGDYPKLNSQFRNELLTYFEPYNRELYDYLGVDFGWDK